MINDKFTTSYTVDYSSLLSDLTITFPRFMLYVQETSLRHTDSTNRPMRWYAENQMGWVITHWQIEIYKYPKFNENITIKTWPSGFKGFFGERCFEACDAQGNVLLAANSNWIYTDLAKRKPSRPSAELLNEYGALCPMCIPKDFSFPDLSDYTKILSRTYIVARRDIDTNGHVNNVKYIEWANDDIPDEIYQSHHAVSTKVAYKKECVKGEKLMLELYKNAGGKTEFITLIRKFDNPDTIAAEIFSVWEKTEG